MFCDKEIQLRLRKQREAAASARHAVQVSGIESAGGEGVASPVEGHSGETDVDWLRRLEECV